MRRAKMKKRDPDSARLKKTVSFAPMPEKTSDSNDYVNEKLSSDEIALTKQKPLSINHYNSNNQRSISVTTEEMECVELTINNFDINAESVNASSVITLNNRDPLDLITIHYPRAPVNNITTEEVLGLAVNDLIFTGGGSGNACCNIS